MPDSLDQLNARLLAFARERDWEQFHSPKNLAMALAGEAGELLEHFQWLTEQQSAELSAEKKRQVAHELADILNYLVRLAERLDIDLLAAADEKIAINAARYPADKVRGDARRASEYGDEDGASCRAWSSPGMRWWRVLHLRRTDRHRGLSRREDLGPAIIRR
jgi:dCTP diphosphatase